MKRKFTKYPKDSRKAPILENAEQRRGYTDAAKYVRRYAKAMKVLGS